MIVRTLLFIILFLVFCCTCVGPLWAIYASAKDPALGLATVDWKAVEVSLLVAVVTGGLLFLTSRIGESLAEARENITRKPTNSELRQMYYPSYVNKQEAERQQAAERETYNTNSYTAAFWAGANSYIDFDGNERRVKQILDDYYPEGSFAVGDDEIIKARVAPPRSRTLRTKVEIVRRG
jgi:hypothetical protein